MASNDSADKNVRVDASKSKQLSELLQETVKIAVSTGPRGLTRALQAGDAVGALVREFVQNGGRADPPQVVLRKLFEKLGWYTIQNQLCAL